MYAPGTRFPLMRFWRSLFRPPTIEPVFVTFFHEDCPMLVNDAITVCQRVCCPNCRRDFEAKLWRIVDAEKSPEASASLLAGDLCRPQCPECGEFVLLEYPLVYVNPAQALVVELAPASNERVDGVALSEYAELVIRYYAEQWEKEGRDRNVRLVHTMPDLIEKAHIFRDGLDDRIVEIIKYTAQHQAQAQGIDAHTIRYWREGEEKLLLCLNAGDEVVDATPLNSDAYAKALTLVGRRRDKSALIVDGRWAASLFVD